MAKAVNDFEEITKSYFARSLPTSNLVELIYEVKKHPVLWNTSHKDFVFKAGLQKRKEAWEEIMRHFISDFDDVTDSQKYVLEKHFLRKWKTLRCCYRRELLRRQQELRDGRPGKQYIYADHLRFLDPHLKVSMYVHERAGGGSGGDNGTDDCTVFDPQDFDISNASFDADALDSLHDIADFEPEAADDDDDYEDEDSKPLIERLSSAKANTIRRKSKRRKSSTSSTKSKWPPKQDEGGVSTTTASNHEDDSMPSFIRQSESLLSDVDALFMLSLVQDLKKLPEIVKLEVKSDLLKVMTQARKRVQTR